MLEVFDDFDQGSGDWFSVRLGIPTASKFATVMAKGEGKTRSDYMRKLAGEILTGEPMDSYSNAYMERGTELEDQARQKYAFVEAAELQRVAFLKNGAKGCSPDSLVGDSGGLEIKIAIPSVQIERLERGGLPPEHKAQVQGNLWIAEREWWDFVSDCPRLPQLKVRVYPDKAYLKTLADEVERFNDELAAMVERIRHYDEQSALLKNKLVQSLVAG